MGNENDSGPREFAISRMVAVLAPDARILEIGCGGAAATKRLMAQGFAIDCADVEQWHEAIEGLHHTSGANLSHRLPFADDSYEAILSLEVLEHVTNPFNAISEYGRILKSDGQLFLTIPNFWDLAARWRFFLTGNINRSKIRDANARENLRLGRCPPHINTMPWPILKFTLAAHGFVLEDLVGVKCAYLKRLHFLPLAVAIAALTWLAGRTRRRRFELNECNRWSLLFGSHVFLRARKVGVEAAGRELAAS